MNQASKEFYEEKIEAENSVSVQKRTLVYYNEEFKVKVQKLEFKFFISIYAFNYYTIFELTNLTTHSRFAVHRVDYKTGQCQLIFWKKTTGFSVYVKS